MKTYGIVGAGGFGREVMPLAVQALQNEVSAGTAEIVFVVESPSTKQPVNGIPVLSLEDFLDIDGEKSFNIAIGSSEARRRISGILQAAGLPPFPIAANNSLNLSFNEIGEGSVLCPFTMITSNSKIGRFFHANIYSYVAHDCVIGDYVTFAPSVKCNGNVVVEDDVYIGTGAVIREGKGGSPLIIGKGAVIGMGAVVTRSVPSNTVVVGNPARKLENG